MWLVILLLLLALPLGGIGLFVEALRWILIVALIVLAASSVAGRMGRAGRA